MNNTKKDRYENKLNRFIKECDRLWSEYKVKKSIKTWSDLETHNRIIATVQKQFGLTEDDLRKAWSLRRHKSDRDFWCDSRFHKGEQRQKAYDRAEKNGIRAQYTDEELEAWIKDEDDFIMDVYDWQ